VSKKIRKQALRMALSSKLGDNEMLVLDELALPANKTKSFVEVLKTLGVDTALVVIPEPNETVELSARNVRAAKVLRAEGLNVYDILRYRHLILTKGAVPRIETALLSQGR
jgi:large subunit ribosomal protein L4